MLHPTTRCRQILHTAPLTPHVANLYNFHSLPKSTLFGWSQQNTLSWSNLSMLLEIILL